MTYLVSILQTDCPGCRDTGQKEKKRTEFIYILQYMYIMIHIIMITIIKKVSARSFYPLKDPCPERG